MQPFEMGVDAQSRLVAYFLYNLIMGNFKSDLKGFQCIPNNLIFDSTISDRARFVYCYMAAKPEGWNFFLKPMAEEIGYSVDTLRKYINELIERGWLVKGEQINDGRFGCIEYTLKSDIQLPCMEKPCTENTDSENFRLGKTPTQYNIDNINNIDNEYNTNKKKEKELNKFNSQKKFDFSNIQEDFIPLVNEWLQYKIEIKDPYKGQRGLTAFYNKLYKLSNGNVARAKEIMEQSMANNWKGIFPLQERLGNSHNMPTGMILDNEQERAKIYAESKKDLW